MDVPGIAAALRIIPVMATVISQYIVRNSPIPLITIKLPLSTRAPFTPETLHGEAAVLAKILRRATLPEGPNLPRRAMQLAKQMKMEMRAELGRC